jgi:transcriptional regulator with XRE-family HTH domain
MARAALSWSAADLAKASGLGYATVARFESGHNLADTSVATIQAALEAAGATFSASGDRVAVSVPR